MLSRIARFPIRVFRHILLDRSYQSYYSADSWEHKYREENYNLGDPNEDGRYGALMKVLHRYDGGAMLDVGCGDGLLWRYYRPLSNSALVGVDYSETAIAKAKALAIPNSNFEVGDYRGYNPGRSFSVVVFNESLYYIDDFLDALATAESWLDTDGVVIISMFNTLVTQRIWKKVIQRRPWIQSISVHDHCSKRVWTIRVFPSTSSIGA